MTFDRAQLRRARDGLQFRLPDALRRDLDKASHRIGPYGVRVARSLVAVGSGRTHRNIRYDVTVQRGHRPGWTYTLTVEVNFPGGGRATPEIFAAFVTEFGRGQGPTGHRARSILPPRPYLRPSRVLAGKRARGAFARAMRTAAKSALGG